MNTHKHKSNRRASTMRRAALFGILTVTVLLGGCAIGPGTATGTVLGTVAGAVSGNPAKGAAIGAGIGATVDILNGQAPVEPLPPRRGGRYDDRYYEEEPVYRPVPPRRLPPRRLYWDDYCRCYR